MQIEDNTQLMEVTKTYNIPHAQALNNANPPTTSQTSRARHVPSEYTQHYVPVCARSCALFFYVYIAINTNTKPVDASRFHHTCKAAATSATPSIDDQFSSAIIYHPARVSEVQSVFFQTSRPRTQVLSTLPLRSSTTISASAPARSVPFLCSMPRHFAGLYVAHLIASPSEQPVKREKLRTHLSSVTTLRTPTISPKQYQSVDQQG